MSETASTISVIQSYDELRQAIAFRRKNLGLTQFELDYITGLPDGYQGKIECGVRHFGSLSLGLVLQALGLEIVVRPVASVEPAC